MKPALSCLSSVCIVQPLRRPHPSSNFFACPQASTLAPAVPLCHVTIPLLGMSIHCVCLQVRESEIMARVWTRAADRDKLNEELRQLGFLGLMQ